MADEKLATTRVTARMSHGQGSSDVLVFVNLALDGVAGATGSGSIGTSPLNHEVGDDTVEIESIVKPFLREVDEVFNRIGGILIEKIDVDRAFIGF